MTTINDVQKNKKVLLIYPGRVGLEYSELPLSILFLGAWLEKHGIPCELIDMRFSNYQDIDTEDLLFVGVSTMTGTMIKSALTAAEYFKTKAPSLPIVWGGVHASMLPEQTLEDPNVDIVVVGEGEETILELARTLQDGGDITNIKGLAYKKDGKTTVNPCRDFIDMNRLPIELPYDKLKMENYFLETFPIHTSRGCPYRCGFCYNPVFNKRRYRVKSAERVLEEIDYIIKKFNPKKLSFTQEDEFFIDLDRVKKIAQGLLDKKYNIEWESFCRLNSFLKMDDEMLKLVEKSRCVMLSFGGESGNQEILDLIEKDSKVEWMYEVARRMSKTNINMVISYMMGLPGETYEQFLNTCKVIDNIVKIHPKCCPNGLFLYTPYPGTKLMNLICEKYNYQMPASLKDWGDFKVYRNMNMPWLSKSTIRKYKYISIASRFPFYKDHYTIPVSLDKGIFSRLVYHFYAKVIRLRWKHKMFAMPLELMVLEYALEKKRGYV